MKKKIKKYRYLLICTTLMIGRASIKIYKFDPPDNKWTFNSFETRKEAQAAANKIKKILGTK